MWSPSRYSVWVERHRGKFDEYVRLWMGAGRIEVVECPSVLYAVRCKTDEGFGYVRFRDDQGHWVTDNRYEVEQFIQKHGRVWSLEIVECTEHLVGAYFDEESGRQLIPDTLNGTWLWSKQIQTIRED